MSGMFSNELKNSHANKTATKPLNTHLKSKLLRKFSSLITLGSQHSLITNLKNLKLISLSLTRVYINRHLSANRTF